MVHPRLLPFGGFPTQKKTRSLTEPPTKNITNHSKQEKNETPYYEESTYLRWPYTLIARAPGWLEIRQIPVANFTPLITLGSCHGFGERRKTILSHLFVFTLVCTGARCAAGTGMLCTRHAREGVERGGIDRIVRWRVPLGDC
jgi:hypothetical protein